MLLIKVLLFFCYCVSSQSLLLSLAPLSLGQAIRIYFEQKRKRESGKEQNSKRRKEKEEKPHQCDVCGKICDRIGHLNKHKRTHTGEKPYKCAVCGKSFSTQGILTTHARTHTGERAHQCDLCEKSFGRRDHLENHKRTHTGEKPYKCTVCEKSFAQSGHLSTHKKVHLGESLYQCDACEKCFSTEDILKNHERMHSLEKPYECEIYQENFPTSMNLMKHSKIHPKIHLPQEEIQAGQESNSTRSEIVYIVYNECAQTFIRDSSLNIHERMHPVEKPYECDGDGCNERFEDSVSLKWHKLKHDTDRSFQCFVCKSFFTKGSLLYLHGRKHLKKKEMLFSCAKGGCGGKYFSTRLELYLHNTTLHINHKIKIEDWKIECYQFLKNCMNGNISGIDDLKIFFKNNDERLRNLTKKKKDPSLKSIEIREDEKEGEFLLLEEILSLLLDVRWSVRNHIENQNRGVEKNFPKKSYLLINDLSFLGDIEEEKLGDSEFALFLTILLNVFHAESVPSKLRKVLNEHMPDRSA